MSQPSNFLTLTFKTLIGAYNKLQSQLTSQVKVLAKSTSGASPAKFILVQFAMSQVAQIGESISNLISQVNSVINNSVRNQKTQ